MKLIFINKIGKNYQDEFIYEFIFSNSTENVDGSDWDSYPAKGNPGPPNIDLIKKVGVLVTTLNLDLIQNSNSFSIWDAVDGLIAFAWENIEGYEEYPDHRLYFHFGEDIKSIESKLYAKDIILTYNKQYDKISK
jgi:hypothetical protein